jgi:hypothetical protein
MLRQALVITLANAACISACLSTDPSIPRIERVEVVGDPEANDMFTLKITGIGLASSVAYDLSTKESAFESFRVELVGVGLTTIAPERVELMTTRELLASIRGPIPEGVWGVRLYDGDRVVAEQSEGFRVGRFAADSGPVEEPDAGSLGAEDAGTVDAGELDAGVVDAGGSNDGRPFIEGYQFRQRLRLENATNANAPAATTFRLPIPHAALIAEGRAKTDGTDLAPYLGSILLPFQWDDRAKLGTDSLVMIVSLPIALPPGVYNDEPPLYLYYGDQSKAGLTNDSTYFMVSRFDEGALPANWGNAGRNSTTGPWTFCAFDRPSEQATPLPGAMCALDTNNQHHRTVTTPLLLTNLLPPNAVYEVSFHFAGRMVNQSNDLLYLAFYHSTVSGDYHRTFQISPTACPPGGGVDCFVEGVPNVPMFRVSDNVGDSSNHNKSGWRLPAAQTQWWTRTTARFRPATPAPAAVHIRWVSNDNTRNNDTLVIVDDITIRLALDPEFLVELGPVQSR